jgi:membrane protease YdiL (CAAX protease family)
MALVLLEFAFAEEIVFRLGIQNYLARLFRLQGNRYWIAIVLTGLFWSLAHASILDPEWVKIAQVFPLGLALGYVFKQYGTEACILVHGVFNVIMMFLAPFLIST